MILRATVAAVLELLEQEPALAVRLRRALGLATETRGPSAPALLDRAGLAKALGVSLPLVDRLRAENCPRVKIGDVDRFELGAVLEWLKTRGGKLRALEGGRK